MLKNILKKTYKLISVILLSIYSFAVLYITLFNRTSTIRKVNFTPFWELKELLKFDSSFYMFLYFIVGNIIMTIPLGILLPIISKRFRNSKYIFIVGFLTSCFIEITQYITARGLCEFDDIFNNTLGALLGFFIWKYFLVKQYNIINRKL